MAFRFTSSDMLIVLYQVPEGAPEAAVPSRMITTGNGRTHKLGTGALSTEETKQNWKVPDTVGLIKCNSKHRSFSKYSADQEIPYCYGI
jgi:hypothetical protein